MSHLPTLCNRASKFTHSISPIINMIRVWLRRDSEKAKIPSGGGRGWNPISVGQEITLDIPLPIDMSKIVLTGKGLQDGYGLTSFHGSELDLQASRLPCGRKGWTITKAAKYTPGSYHYSIHKEPINSNNVFRLHVTFANSDETILIRIPSRIPLSAIKADGTISDLTAVAFLNRPNARQVATAQIVRARINRFKVTRWSHGFTTAHSRRLHDQNDIEIVPSADAGTLFTQSRQILLDGLVKKIMDLNMEDREFIIQAVAKSIKAKVQ